MKEINVVDLIPIFKNLILEANFHISEDVMERLRFFNDIEESQLAKEILSTIIKNHEKAPELRLPPCQDTGMVVAFLEIGQDIHLTGGDINDAVNEAVKQAYKEGYLRKSIVDDPFAKRLNTGDNTPAIIHTEIIPGDAMKITVAPKGGGAENMSRIAMLKPADGLDGIKQFILDTVEQAGGNPCPPIIVGVGIGGNFEACALASKKALMRDIRIVNDNPELATIESELLEKVNKLGIGPMGLGGRTTALGVNIISLPCHIATLPVAVNIQCHASRHKTITIRGNI